jgi:hypothetical protein
MTSPENVIARWSRLKRNSDTRRGTNVATAIERPKIAAADAPFDPANLPSIDVIDVDTDIRGFLQRGVPAELTRDALRRAWANDPAIRDFIGIAENQWDFNDPDAIPGFGPLPEGCDVASLLSKALGGREQLAEAVVNTYTSIEQSRSAVSEREFTDAALDLPRSTAAELGRSPDERCTATAEPENHDTVAEASDRPLVQRRHGSALPRQGG